MRINISKAVDEYFDNYSNPITGEKFKKEECWIDVKQTKKCAKHFFELGRKSVLEWIDCNERQPDKKDVYLVITDYSYNDTYDMAWWDGKVWHKASKILYWMPIPLKEGIPNKYGYHQAEKDLALEAPDGMYN
jgi:hypothetical protein